MDMQMDRQTDRANLSGPDCRHWLTYWCSVPRFDSCWTQRSFNLKRGFIITLILIYWNTGKRCEIISHPPIIQRINRRSFRKSYVNGNSYGEYIGGICFLVRIILSWILYICTNARENILNCPKNLREQDFHTKKYAVMVLVPVASADKLMHILLIYCCCNRYVDASAPSDSEEAD